MPRSSNARAKKDTPEAVWLDVHAALVRDVKPPLPEYDPANEMTISDMVEHLNRLLPPDTAPWNRVSVEREMKRLGPTGKVRTWTCREVLKAGRKAQAWRPVEVISK